ncbi:hypothetical protein JMJ55_18450 [Belnapia sp. T6]|uniref:Uncharacterized protein n=1 Tax=Belnapia mucosa TaxID=2804532 RepID=A0ABS1V6L4_9PROT|nr:hypothetical protein [Belnapia mucosa]MBL6457319.1 hypothetical protein [Belnapia mucosa]
MKRIAALLFLLTGLSEPAAAQQRVVVPGDAAVVVPARGAGAIGGTAALRRPRRVIGDRLPPPPESGSSMPLLVALPLGVAAGLLAATLGGNEGHGNVSAPARTR